VATIVGLALFGTVAIAATTTAPTTSEINGQVTDILQTTSFQISNPTPDELKDYLALTVAKYGGNYYLLSKVIGCESGWDYKQHNPNSEAAGIAEFMPSTFKGYCGGDFTNPYDQIKCLVIAWSGGYDYWWNASRGCWVNYLNN
jgi:hypothetical protein